MKTRNRIIKGLFNAAIDSLILILVLLLYYFFSLYLSRLGIGFMTMYGGTLSLIIVFILLSFLRGFLSGHVLSIPLIVAEALVITYVFISVPSTIQYAGAIINITPIKSFLLGVQLSWYVYSLVSELHDSLLIDP